jgi:hypothetical protein
MSGETPTGSPEGLLSVTSKKFPILIAARKIPVGASSATTSLAGIGKVPQNCGNDRSILTEQHRRGT